MSNQSDIRVENIHNINEYLDFELLKIYMEDLFDNEQNLDVVFV